MTSYLLSGPLKDPSPFVVVAQTPKVLESARLPAAVRRTCGSTGASSWRWLLAVGVWWLLYRSTLGFEIRTVGANPSAARYAGISRRRHDRR